MKRIGIIQISDTQFGDKHVFGNPSRIASKLTFDITELSKKHVFVPLSIVIAGDIAETAHNNEFDQGLSTIKTIASDLAVDENMIFVTPGNHDINWKLSEVSDNIGDPNIKLQPFAKMLNNLTKNYNFDNSQYPIIHDHRFGITYLLIDSCEKESHLNHTGYVEVDKLLDSIKSISKEEENYFKIAIAHHALKNINDSKHEIIENASEIEPILLQNNFQLYMFGHTHQNTHSVNKSGGKNLIHIGSGSAGINFSGRVDGVQNQYIVHVLDLQNSVLESYFRSFNPQSGSSHGKGKWTTDNTYEKYPIENIVVVKPTNSFCKENLIADKKFMDNLRIRTNPFTYNNAEKISIDLIIDLFVRSSSRHDSATRLVGDGIIRGKRGSGKTMLLKFLEVIAKYEFKDALKHNKIANVFPVPIDLSHIHKSEWGEDIDKIFETADKLIFDCVINELENINLAINSPSFRSSLFQLKQRLDILKNQDGSLISKLGQAIKLHMSPFFNHVLLLIDEIAPVFPKKFFSDLENGFYKWMNAIRNSGPFYTRVAVYPNDISDKLNEERYGSIINLDFNVQVQTDYIEFYSYCTELVNKYLKSVSLDKDSPTTINNIIDIQDDSTKDCLEQLIYASDGSSRRFLSLMDRVLVKLVNLAPNSSSILLHKDDIISIITDYAKNHFRGYEMSFQELTNSIATACKRQSTFRFKFPNSPSSFQLLCSGREEFNIIKIIEVGKGQKATTFEFSYPYCIYFDIPTHNIIDTRKICTSRSLIDGEWIKTTTKIEKDNLEFYSPAKRISGKISEIDSDIVVIKGTDGKEYLGRLDGSELALHDEVTFIPSSEEAFDIIRISKVSQLKENINLN